MFIYMGGVPGVGKTTIIAETLKLAQKTGFSLQSMKESKVLYRLTGVASANEYRLLPETIRSIARQRMVALFYRLDRKNPKTVRLRDDHFVYLKEDGSYFIRPCIPEDKIQMLAFVVLFASSRTICDRRLQDSPVRPERNFTNCDAIARHQEMELQTAFSQAEQLRIPIRIFSNENTGAAQVSQLILSFIRENV